MKILEICTYSAGTCGVWSRAREEAKRLSEIGHKVEVFSSFFEKGTDKIVKRKDNYFDVGITRFKAKKLGGESFSYFDFVKEGVEYAPDVIITHNYRQIHTTKALKIAKILRKKGKKVKVFLVTHAPFVEGNITRSLAAKIAVNVYDKVIGPMTLNKFDKILTISKWEEPYLIKIGARANKIKYIPNGIPEEFFNTKIGRKEKKILFLSRISPKKKVETLIEAIPYIKDKNIKIEIVGPKEKEYFEKIEGIIKKLGVEKRVIISEPIFNIKEKIKKIDSASIFVLPSRVEGMPQALIEAMSREKIVIGSDSIAIRDIIKNKDNGYLFEFDNPKELAKTINMIDEKSKKEIQKIEKNAKNSVKKFSWEKVIDEIDKTIGGKI